MRHSDTSAPVAIGGVGGSGTRLIAALVRELGYYMGDDQNVSNDNHWFALLFKRLEFASAQGTQQEFDRAVRLFRLAMTGEGSLLEGDRAWLESLGDAMHSDGDSAWVRERIASLLRATASASRRGGPWGWKEPNTHVVIDRLPAAFPGMKYIHVMRNGLDMAYSENQNQLRLWGRHFLEVEHVEVSPRWSLKYWCRVQQRVVALGARMPGRFLLLNYDAFCAQPDDGLRELVGFLGCALDAAQRPALIAMVRPPPSVGRFAAHGLGVFDPEDVAYARSLGF